MRCLMVFTLFYFVFILYMLMFLNLYRYTRICSYTANIIESFLLYIGWIYVIWCGNTKNTTLRLYLFICFSSLIALFDDVSPFYNIIWMWWWWWWSDEGLLIHIYIVRSGMMGFFFVGYGMEMDDIFGQVSIQSIFFCIVWLMIIVVEYNYIFVMCMKYIFYPSIIIIFPRTASQFSWLFSQKSSPMGVVILMKWLKMCISTPPTFHT